MGVVFTVWESNRDRGYKSQRGICFLFKEDFLGGQRRYISNERFLSSCLNHKKKVIEK